MFGYVRPLIGRLMVCEYEHYRAVYCGVCKAMGRIGGPWVRLTLSYDFVFVALLRNAALGQPLHTVPFRCKLNPLRRRTLCVNDEALEFAACAALIMTYFKAVDDLNDSRGFARLKPRLALPFLRRAAKKAAARTPELFGVMENCIREQQSVETSESVSPDAAAHPGAEALGQLLALADENCRQPLYEFGYLLGRWVYLADAADDLYDDRLKRRFNPLDRYTREQAEEMLNLTVTETAARYDALPAKFRHPIVDNIIMLGLPAEQKKVLAHYGQAVPHRHGKEKHGEQKPL